MPRRTATADEAAQVDLDVDVPSEPLEDDETETIAQTDPNSEPSKAAEKQTKEPARGSLPEGYVTPVGLAHELSKPLDGNAENTDPSNWRYTAGRGANQGSHVVAPQMVYSYLKNVKAENDPRETVKDSLGKDRTVIKLETGLAWWDAKNKRTAERAENAKAKADKKAAKDAEKPEGETSEPVAEVVEAE